MDKDHVVDLLEEIAVLLELKGENVFKSRAYKNAARAIESMAEDLAKLVTEERLGEIPGIGEALQKKITELVTTGHLPYYEELKASFPPGLLSLLTISGLGPKKVKTLHEQLQIVDLASLEAACNAHRVAELPGFGAKTEANILRSIAQQKTYQSMHRAGDVVGLAQGLVDALRECPEVVRVSEAGSLRRGKEILHDLDLLASAATGKAQAVMDYFVALPGIEQVLNHGETKSSVLLSGGVQCDLRVVSDREFPYALHHFTGSKEHNVAMRQRAISQGKKLSEWGLFQESEKSEKDQIEKEPNGPLILCQTEEEIFHELGLSFIPPELRENLGEIEAAEKNEIPKLVEWTNLRGVFHCHTNASDGRNTLAEMVEAAHELGFDYLGIADHSKSSFQANGLSEEQILQQQAEIKKLNAAQSNVLIFSGIECDILKEGLDYSDEVLASFDYVVASLHNATGLDEAEATRRTIAAMENPYVTLLAHPTGRLLLQREPYPVNLNRVLEAAVATGTWIELNANTRRLDLDWRWWRRAREMGVRCVLNPDAHSIGGFDCLRLGIQIARKGWLRRDDVVNTVGREEIKKRLGEKRARFGR